MPLKRHLNSTKIQLNCTFRFEQLFYNFKIFNNLYIYNMYILN